MCKICKEPALFVCTECNQVFYCSEACQRADWPEHQRICSPDRSRTRQQPLQRQQQQQLPNSSANSEELGNQDEMIENLAFYIEQLYVIMKPVTSCILLSVLWVKLANPYQPYFAVSGGGYSRPSLSNQFGSDGSDGSSVDSSLVIAGIIAGQIVVVTVIIALLIKYKKVQFIYYFFGLVISVILGYFAYSLGYMLLLISNSPLDWISFAFFLWNFVTMGLCSIFWQAPLELQQVYLVLMSSMMAYSLSNLPSLVTWILLSFLAVWDLVAVLCPYGPLRIMIESAQQNNIELPSALIYTTAISFMADIEHETAPSPTSNNSNTQDNPVLVAVSTGNLAARSESRLLHDRPSTFADQQQQQHHHHQESIEMQTFSSPLSHPSQPTSQQPRRQNRQQQVQGRPRRTGQAGSGLKLGLGDFVFYSVLVGRASLSDWLTTIGCMLSVLSGLVITIFILVLKRKPLPALPISIFFGIGVYFLVSLTMANMIQCLSTGSFQVAPLPLIAGSQGIGFVFI